MSLEEIPQEHANSFEKSSSKKSVAKKISEKKLRFASQEDIIHIDLTRSHCFPSTKDPQPIPFLLPKSVRQEFTFHPQELTKCCFMTSHTGNVEIRGYVDASFESSEQEHRKTFENIMDTGDCPKAGNHPNGFVHHGANVRFQGILSQKKGSKPVVLRPVVVLRLQNVELHGFGKGHKKDPILGHRRTGRFKGKPIINKNIQQGKFYSHIKWVLRQKHK